MGEGGNILPTFAPQTEPSVHGEGPSLNDAELVTVYRAIEGHSNMCIFSQQEKSDFVTNVQAMAAKYIELLLFFKFIYIKFKLTIS